MGKGLGRGTRGRVGAILGPLAFVALWAAPLPLALPAHRLAAVFALVLVLWVSEALPIAVTALLIAPLLVVSGVTDAPEAFRHYADPLLFLFVGGFFIARAMRRHGLDRRIAQGVLRLPFVAAAPSRVRLAILLVAGLLSMWISNTAATAILVPILLGLFPNRGPGQRGALLSLAYICSIGGLGSLVGSPPNALTVRALAGAGVDLGFIGWMKIGLPTALLLGAATHLLCARLFPSGAVSTGAPSQNRDEAEDDGDEEDEGEAAGAPGEPMAPLGPISRGEIVTALCFALAIVGWVVPGVLEAMGHPAARLLSNPLKPGVVAMLASAPLFMVPTARVKEAGSSETPEGQEPVLPWRDAARIDWGIIFLFGGGIALGKQLVDTGLADILGRGFLALSGIEDMWTLTFVVCLFTIFFTEICSNTASANMLAPLVIAMATELGVSPVPPALAVGLAASCAFMLPIATGPNAIVYATGRVPQATMIRVGVLLNVVAALLIFAVLRFACPLFGWA